MAGDRDCDSGRVFCDICCGPANLLDTRENSASAVLNKDLLAGSSRSHILNAHLRTYFIANKLLKCSQTDSLRLLTFSTDSTGDQSQSVFSVCNECEKTVTKALELHYKILAVQNEINKLGKVLIGQIKQSCRNRDSYMVTSSLGIELRKLLGLDDRNFAHNVKQEVITETNDEDYENFDDELLESEILDVKSEPSETVKPHPTVQLSAKYNKRVLSKRITKLKTYARDERGNFICKFCKSLYTTYPGIVKHYRMHKESRLLGKIYDCNICRHPNLSDSKLRRHMKKIHGIQQGKGDVSNRVCAQQQDIEQDGTASLQSGNESDYSSEYSSEQRKSDKIKTSTSSDALSQSESNVVSANVEETHFCKLCDSVFTSLPGYNKHVGVHEQSRLLGNKYDCPTCKHPAISESGLSRHITEAHPTESESFEESEINASATDVVKSRENTYPCKLCDSVYTTIPGYNKHKRAHEQSRLLGNKYDCPTCRHPNVSESNLRRHITAIHQNKSSSSTEKETTTSSSILPSISKYTCQRCESVYTSFTGIKKHERIHRESDELGNQFDCPVCRHPTVSDKNLRLHIAVTHQNKISSSVVRRGQVGNFACERCDSIYTSYTGIKKHERIHKESDDLGNVYDCPVCRHPTTSEKNLRIHISVIHQNRIPPECQEQVIAKLPSMDIDRLQVSSNEAMETGNFYCDRCESVYTSVTGIRKHERMHEESDLIGNKYDCSICRHPTVSGKNLRIHMTMTHQMKIPFENTEKKVNVDNSDSAPKSSNSKAAYDNESDDSETEGKSYTQSSDGNFHCKLCKSVYTTYPGIIKHDRMHKQSNLLGNMYDCSICRHPNLSDFKLRRHTKVVHLKLLKKGQNYQSMKFKNETSTTSKTVSNNIASNNDDMSDDDDGTKSDINDEDWTPDNEFKKRKGSNKQQSAMNSSGENELYYCDLCNVGYKSARGYQKHEEEHQASESLGHKYDCYCGFPASSEQRLRYHKKRVHLDAFTCSICGYQVQKVEQLAGHMRKHYKSDNKFNKVKGSLRVRIRDKKAPERMECHICKVKYWFINSFKKHMEDHEKTEQINKIWDCDICNFPCFSEKQLRRHQTKHGRKKVACTICQKIFANPPLLKAHMRLHAEYDDAEDPATGLFSCKLCPYIGRSLRALIAHKTALHRETILDSSVEYLLCPQCGKSFYNMGTLRKHIKNIHENTYTYTCENCGKGFDSKSAFHDHKMTHQEIRTKDHTCETCGMSYSHKHTLHAHITKFHSTKTIEQLAKIPDYARDGRRFPKAKDHICRWCNAVFPFKYMLVNHIPTAHEDLYTYSCDKCDKKYITPSSLKLHKEIAHSDGSQTFACKYCQKVFAHKHYAICHYKSCDAKRNMDQGKFNME